MSLHQKSEPLLRLRQHQAVWGTCARRCARHTPRGSLSTRSECISRRVALSAPFPSFQPLLAAQGPCGPCTPSPDWRQCCVEAPGPELLHKGPKHLGIQVESWHHQHRRALRGGGVLSEACCVCMSQDACACHAHLARVVWTQGMVRPCSSCCCAAAPAPRVASPNPMRCR